MAGAGARRRARHHRRVVPARSCRDQPAHPDEAELSGPGQAGGERDLGSSAAHVRYKHITVVDDDIDIHDYAAVDWAIAYRVNAGEDDIIIMPSTFGAGLDPSTRRRDRNPALFGTGKWTGC